MKKIRTNKKGFTLAELLIVVAIVGVLVAISIPIFTAQLAKARLATNQANARAAYAAAEAAYLEDDNVRMVTYTTSAGTASTASTSASTDSNLGSGNNIQNWKTATSAGTGTYNLGNHVFGTWKVMLNTDGSVAGFSAEN